MKPRQMTPRPLAAKNIRCALETLEAIFVKPPAEKKSAAGVNRSPQAKTISPIKSTPPATIRKVRNVRGIVTKSRGAE